PIVTKTIDGKETVIPPTSVEDKAQRKAELKARSTFKRRAFWSLNEDILKITILKTNTPYPSRRYGVSVPALTKDHKRNEDQYAVSRGLNTPYSRYGINIIFWKISNVVPTLRNPQYAVSNTWIRRDLDNSTNNVLIPLDSWTSGLLVYRLPLSGTESRLQPYHFNYPERSLTMEGMLNKFIDEGKREHEEMRAFIYDFQTILFKERNNSLIELRFGVQELLNIINNVPMIDYEVKGVTTRGGKTTTHDVHNNDTNRLPKEFVVVEPEKPAEPNEVLTNDQPQITSRSVVQPSNEVQPLPVPFPKRLRKEKDEAQQKKFLENLKQLHINLPFIEALAQMSKYAKFLKGWLTNKIRLEETCKIIMNERFSVVLLNKLPSKEKDPWSFTIPCDIGQLHIDNALADLGASISLIPYTMYKKLGLGEPKATRMSLELTDRSIQYSRGIIKDVLIKVDKIVLPIDSVILDMPEDSRVLIILGRSFLATAQVMIDVFNKKITLRVGDDEVIFDVDQSIKRPTTKDDECYGIDDLDEMINEEARELLKNEEPDSFLSRGLEKSIDQSDLECCESTSSNDKNGSDLENSIRHIDSINTSYPVTQRTSNGDNVKSEHLYSASANEIDEKKLELKNLPQHLEYAYLHGDKSFPIIISSELSENEKTSLLQVLERRKGAIAWKMSNIKGISPSYCTYKILMKDDYKPVIQPQRRLNPKVQDVVKNEIDSSKYQSLWRIKRRPPSPILMGLSLTDECRLDYVMLLMLAKCEETNLMLNWEKCHFMVKEGIVLGHKIYGAGIEVDRAKIDAITKLPYPTNVKGVRSFLGHAGFYRRFIKDFSMISKPMTQLLMKDAKFDFFDDCKKAFNILKQKLTTAPIIISPDWNEPFELMCDASDFAVGTVLGQ
ncbi:DNA-directed DNA polymerase, partial [Tanacetum coccineum]